MRGREIDVAERGRRVRGHEVSAGDAAPALVLLPDVHGVSDLYREIAGRFAAQGFTTLALDLYAREGTPKLASPAEALQWIARLPDDRVLGDVAAAIEHLADTPDGRRPVGITGFCMGGQYALLAACSLPGLSACVSFYGMLRYAATSAIKPRSPLDAADDLGCPYLGIFGTEDGFIPLADVDELEARLTRARKTFEIGRYAGCGHAFLNSTRPEAFRPDAAADAFARAVEFFRRHLRSPR